MTEEENRDYTLLDSQRYQAEGQLEKAERLLDKLGYRPCDIAACNCGSYHRFKSPWIAVRDRTPPLDEPVIAARRGDTPLVTFWLPDGWMFVRHPTRLPTHWMPIPPMPE